MVDAGGGGGTRSAIGMCSAGRLVLPFDDVPLGAISIEPKRKLPSAGAPVLSIVNTTWRDSPGFRVRLAGRIVPAKPRRLRRHWCFCDSVLRNVRVKVHTPVQLAFWMAARFRVEASPPKAGLAASKRALVSLSTSPARAARSACTRPAPPACALAGVVPSSSNTLRVAVMVSADLISGTVHDGCSWRISAAAPAVCGEAIEVPLIVAI